MSKLKTKVSNISVTAFIKSVEPELKRKDCLALLKLFKDVTGEKPKLWGTSIIGFGSYHYKSEKSKQEGDWMITGFSPRKQNLTIYIMPGFKEHGVLMKKLGKYKASVSCLYFKRLTDIDLEVLTLLINQSVIDMKRKYG